MDFNNIDESRVPHGCLIKIKAVYESLKSAERKAADHILSQPQGIGGASIGDVAHKAGCSEATLFRLARRMGYAGYPELKAEFANRLDEDSHAEYQGIRRDDSPLTVASKVFDASVVALRDTLQTVKQDEYERALDTLLKAGQIVFCGLGDAATVAQEAFQRFVRIGVDCRVSEDPDSQLILASQLQAGDVLVAISHTGQSKPILKAVKQAKAVGAKVIAITNFPYSALAKGSSLVLLTAVFQEHAFGEVISKRIAELCIVESLYVNYLMRKGEACRAQLGRSNQAVAVNKL